MTTGTISVKVYRGYNKTRVMQIAKAMIDDEIKNETASIIAIELLTNIKQKTNKPFYVDWLITYDFEQIISN